MTVACWVCLCGADNQATAEVCFRCGATRPGPGEGAGSDDVPARIPSNPGEPEKPAQSPRTGLPATAALGLGILLLVAAVLAAWIIFRPAGAPDDRSPRRGRPHAIGTSAGTSRP